jgi:PST family polysaccharide transporter
LFIDAVREVTPMSAAPRQELQTRGARKFFLTFAVIAVGLAGRSALDKVLAVRGGAELVALWAQVSSVIEMVAAVALSGVGAGLSVLAAQTHLAERQQLFLRRALILGLAVSAPVAAAAALAGWRLADVLGGPALGAQTIALAALAGWVAVIHGLVNSYWLGQQRRDLMLSLAFVAAALPLAASVVAPTAYTLELIVVAQALPAAVLFLVPHRADAPRRAEDHALERYVLPGVVIGILSPASMLAARSLVADALSWHESGVLQALWRISDWICGLAAGVLSVLYLPRLAAAYPQPGLGPVLRESAKFVLLPSALLFVALFALHAPLLVLLYDDSFQASPLAAGLIFAGSLARIAAWIPLFGLYAALRTRAIAVGELLSLPLFVALVFAAGDRLTLELVGALWLASYAAYALFNVWALRTPMTNRLAMTIVAARK